MKKMLAIAVATAFAAPAIATADTTLYGKLNAELTSVKGTTGGGVTTKNSDMLDTGSRIGVKGSTPLNAGMAATYVIEYGTDITDNSANQNGGTLSSRQSYVGLKSSYGEFRFGKQVPTKLSSGKVEMFGDQLGDYNARGGLSGNTEASVKDAVAYVNKFGNVGVALMNSSNINGSGSSAVGSNSAWDGMVNYSNNGLYLALGHQNLDNNSALAGGAADTTRLTAAYKFPAGHKVGMALQNAKYTDQTAKGVVISGGYKMGNGMLKAQLGQNKSNAGKAKLAAIGYDYSLGKKTKLMAEYAVGKDNGNTASGIVRPLLTGNVAGGTTKSRGFGMGISHSF